MSDRQRFRGAADVRAGLDQGAVAASYHANLEAARHCLEEARNQAKALGWVTTSAWLRELVKDLAGVGVGPRLRRGRGEEIDAR